MKIVRSIPVKNPDTLRAALHPAWGAGKPPAHAPRTQAEANAVIAAAEAAYPVPSRGRPRKGQRRQVTAVHSLRLPDALWRTVRAKAKRRKLSANAAAIEALAAWAG